MKLAPVSLLLGLAVAGPAAVQAFGQKYERIYFGAWNLGAECGSNVLPGCRDAAVTFLTATTTAGYSPGEAAILMTVGLVDDAGSPIDLTNQGKLAGKNYSKVNGVCTSKNGGKQDNVALTLRDDFQIAKSGGGCLDVDLQLPGAKRFAFAVALVTPIQNRCYMKSSLITNCPGGVCVIGVHAPVNGIFAGQDVVAEVCGLARHRCTVAVGDWNLGSRGATIEDRWTQLLTDKKGTALHTSGPPHAQTTTNIVGSTGAMGIGLGNPLSKQFPNATGIGPLEILDEVLPC